MQRSVERSKNLPAFQLDLAALRLFVEEMSAAFDRTKSMFSIELSLKGEELDFSNIEELESYSPKLPTHITNYKVYWGDFSLRRRCSLNSSMFGVPTIDVTGPDEAWCAGLVAIAEKHAFANSQWFRLFRRWHFGLLAVLLGYLPAFVERIFHRSLLDEKTLMVSWTVLWLLSWVFFISFRRLFPPMKLAIRVHENWFRRYATELTLALALASLAVSLLALFK